MSKCVNLSFRGTKLDVKEIKFGRIVSSNDRENAKMVKEKKSNCVINTHYDLYKGEVTYHFRLKLKLPF